MGAPFELVSRIDVDSCAGAHRPGRGNACARHARTGHACAGNTRAGNACAGNACAGNTCAGAHQCNKASHDRCQGCARPCGDSCTQAEAPGTAASVMLRGVRYDLEGPAVYGARGACQACAAGVEGSVLRCTGEGPGGSAAWEAPRVQTAQRPAQQGL